MRALSICWGCLPTCLPVRDTSVRTCNLAGWDGVSARGRQGPRRVSVQSHTADIQTDLNLPLLLGPHLEINLSYLLIQEPERIIQETWKDFLSYLNTSDQSEFSSYPMESYQKDKIKQKKIKKLSHKNRLYLLSNLLILAIWKHGSVLTTY